MTDAARLDRPRPDCAVFYVSDLNFALPTLISAWTLRRWISPGAADVHVVTIGVPPDVLERMRAFAAGFGIEFWPMDGDAISGFDHSKYNKTHVPPSAIGRFVMTGCVPARYRRLVYLDGDTWIAQDPSALLQCRVPAGRLLAAEDISFFFRRHGGRMGRRVRAYFAGLGIDADRGYFNSGVLAADYETWNGIAADALGFFLGNVERCLYHDQSALNVVAQGRRLRLSPAWNFTPHFAQWGFGRLASPVIHHFAGGHKPWMGRFRHFPAMCGRYGDAMRALNVGALGLPLTAITERERRRVNLRKRAYAAMLPTLLRGRYLDRQAEFKALLRDAMPLLPQQATPAVGAQHDLIPS